MSSFHFQAIHWASEVCGILSIAQNPLVWSALASKTRSIVLSLSFCSILRFCNLQFHQLLPTSRSLLTTWLSLLVVRQLLLCPKAVWDITDIQKWRPPVFWYPTLQGQICISVFEAYSRVLEHHSTAFRQLESLYLLSILVKCILTFLEVLGNIETLRIGCILSNTVQVTLRLLIQFGHIHISFQYIYWFILRSWTTGKLFMWVVIDINNDNHLNWRTS